MFSFDWGKKMLTWFWDTAQLQWSIHPHPFNIFDHLESSSPDINMDSYFKPLSSICSFHSSFFFFFFFFLITDQPPLRAYWFGCMCVCCPLCCRGKDKDKDLFIGPQKFVVRYSKAPEQPQSSARPICHSHAMTRMGREPATICIAA